VALAEAAANATAGRCWTLLDRPLLRLEVAGSTVSLEPDAIAVGPDGRWTVVEIKSFPILDGSADPTKVGAAARQAAVYLLALRATAAALDATVTPNISGPAGAAPGAIPTARPSASASAPASDAHPGTTNPGSSPHTPERGTAVAGIGDPGILPASPYAEPEGLAAAVRTTGLLVCPRDFSNIAIAAPLDLRKQLAVTRRQLARMTRIETLLAVLPEAVRLDEAPEAVDTLTHAYSPECLAACELAFHCRTQARAAGAVEVLGRGVRGELGSLTTVEAALAATADGGALARAARLREEALAR
jgi:hypothetical protein